MDEKPKRKRKSPWDPPKGMPQAAVAKWRKNIAKKIAKNKHVQEERNIREWEDVLPAIKEANALTVEGLRKMAEHISSDEFLSLFKFMSPKDQATAFAALSGALKTGNEVKRLEVGESTANIETSLTTMTLEEKKQALAELSSIRVGEIACDGPLLPKTPTLLESTSSSSTCSTIESSSTKDPSTEVKNESLIASLMTKQK